MLLLEKFYFYVNCREGDISVFRRNMDQPYVYMRDCHSGDVHSVDIYGDIIVSGSRDTTVKVITWRIIFLNNFIICNSNNSNSNGAQVSFTRNHTFTNNKREASEL